MSAQDKFQERLNQLTRELDEKLAPHRKRRQDLIDNARRAFSVICEKARAEFDANTADFFVEYKKGQAAAVEQLHKDTEQQNAEFNKALSKSGKNKTGE